MPNASVCSRLIPWFACAYIEARRISHEPAPCAYLCTARRPDLQYQAMRQLLQCPGFTPAQSAPAATRENRGRHGQARNSVSSPFAGNVAAYIQNNNFFPQRLAAGANFRYQYRYAVRLLFWRIVLAIQFAANELRNRTNEKRRLLLQLSGATETANCWYLRAQQGTPAHLYRSHET